MTNYCVTRRDFALSAAAAGVGLPSTLTRRAFAADMVREGLQIGAMGALRTTLPAAGKMDDLTLDVKDFGDSTSALLALEQGELVHRFRVPNLIMNQITQPGRAYRTKYGLLVVD
jgi:hypothetical protein